MSQFLLAVGIIILLIVCVSWMANRPSVSSMTETPDAVDYFNDFLVWGTLLGAILWQFARRNRWVSLAAILGCAIIASGLSALFSSQKSVDEHYPALQSNLAPLQIAAREANRSNTPPRDFSKVVPLQIPVSVSGLSPGTIVNLNGVKISADSSQISIGGLGWQNHYETIWPEDQRKTFGYAVDRKEYEKIRSQPLHLHIELAFSEYQEADARSLQIPAGSFAAGTLGTCRVSSFGYEFQCFNPLRTPSYIARFDPETVSCPVIPSERNSQAGPVSYAWSYSDAGDYTFDPELSPIVADTLRFSPVSLNPVSAGDEAPSRRSLRLCPGAEIRLSRPMLKRKFRVQIDLPNTRLEDLAERIDID
jgi:hypothetical protein